MYSFRGCLFRLLIVVLIPILAFTIYFYFSPTTSISFKIVINNAKLSLSSISNLSSTSTVRQIHVPDIFELSGWRNIIIGGRGNQTKCIVPRPYRSIADAYCAAYDLTCPMLPCTLVHLSDELTKNVECLRGGKEAIGVKPDWICRKSPALELFSNSQRKPSIIAEAHTRLTAELYGEALAPWRDQETSKWGLTLDGESIGYYPSAAKKKRILSLFDITTGYDRRLFDLIKNVYLPSNIDAIMNNSNQRLTIKQVLQNKVEDHAPILWVNSNCDTPSNRTAYMRELMRYIRVDARGKCGNPNWNQTSTSSDLNVLFKEKTNLAKQYLFTIAIENSLEYDYVTEKLWQPLAVGSVPIYLGAPNIDDWLPCSNYSCIINLRQFSSVYDAANFINQLVKNRTHYIQYHQWRNEEHLRPSFINMANYVLEANKYSIECLICDMVYRNDRGTTRRKLLEVDNPFNDTFPSLI